MEIKLGDKANCVCARARAGVIFLVPQLVTGDIVHCSGERTRLDYPRYSYRNENNVHSSNGPFVSNNDNNNEAR